jgi:hypothetical protein
VRRVAGILVSLRDPGRSPGLWIVTGTIGGVMRSMLHHAAAAATLALLALASPSALQRVITAADVQRLQDGVLDASTEISRLRVRDANRAADLERQLDEIREDVVYLRAVLRREGRVRPEDYDEVQKRLEAVRQQARGGLTGVMASTPGAARNEVPVGAEIDVRLQSELSSGTAQVEDRFEATTVMNLDNAERILIPAGSVLRGVVTGVDRAGRLDRTGRLTLRFDQITIRGRSHPIRATITEALESEGYRGDATRIGAGAAIGAVLGGLLGGVKGALAGILVGGGGVIAATEGKEVTLPAGTILRVRFDAPLTVP